MAKYRQELKEDLVHYNARQTGDENKDHIAGHLRHTRRLEQERRDRDAAAAKESKGSRCLSVYDCVCMYVCMDICMDVFMCVY